MEHILQIAFKDAVPEAWGEIQLYTAGGILATTLVDHRISVRWPALQVLQCCGHAANR